MLRTILMSIFSAVALFVLVPAASAMPVDRAAPASVAEHAATTQVRLVCNRWGRCVRTRPRYYAPPVYFAPRRYYAPRRVYVAPRAYGRRCGWRNGRRACW